MLATITFSTLLVTTVKRFIQSLISSKVNFSYFFYGLTHSQISNIVTYIYNKNDFFASPQLICFTPLTHCTESICDFTIHKHNTYLLNLSAIKFNILLSKFFVSVVTNRFHLFQFLWPAKNVYVGVIQIIRSPINTCWCYSKL